MVNISSVCIETQGIGRFLSVGQSEWQNRKGALAAGERLDGTGAGHYPRHGYHLPGIKAFLMMRRPPAVGIYLYAEMFLKYFKLDGPHRGKGLKVSVEHVGEKARYPYCRRTQTVPPHDARVGVEDYTPCPAAAGAVPQKLID